MAEDVFSARIGNRFNRMEFAGSIRRPGYTGSIRGCLLGGPQDWPLRRAIRLLFPCILAHYSLANQKTLEVC